MPHYNGSTNIAIDDYKLDTYYAMTFSPSDDYQFWNSDERINDFESYVRKNILNKLPFSKYEFYLELSSLGRLHLHGQFKITSHKMLIEFYLHTIRFLSQRANVYIHTIEDEKIPAAKYNSWEQYIKKQYNILGVKFTSEDRILKAVKGASNVPYKKIIME